MARLYGLNGIIRGRQGNNVYSVQNGTQVLKVYQPAVTNPRTLAQQEQRAKFSLAGRMSGVTPSDALIGLGGGSNRSRRAEFVSLLVRNAVVSGSAGSLTASIPYGDIIYSRGSLAEYAVPPTVTATFAGTEGITSRVNVTISAIGAGQLATDAPEGYGELTIVALYDAATSSLDEVRAIERPKGTTPAQLSFRQGARRNCFVAVYAVPFAPAAGRQTFGTSGLNGDDSDVNILASGRSLMAGMEFGQSIFLQVIPVLGTNNMVNPSPVDDMRDVVEDALLETAVSSRKAKK